MGRGRMGVCFQAKDHSMILWLERTVDDVEHFYFGGDNEARWTSSTTEEHWYQSQREGRSSGNGDPGTALPWPRWHPLCPDTLLLIPLSVHLIPLDVQPLPPESGSLLTCSEMLSLMDYISNHLPHQTPSHLYAFTFATFYSLSHCLVKSFGLPKFSPNVTPVVKSSWSQFPHT